jgi:hypothetical protein
MRVAHKELYYQGIREQKGGWDLLLQFLLVYDQYPMDVNRLQPDATTASTTADC